MLPCTPLHHLLLEAAGYPLVMTSANLSDEPIAIANDEARARLAGIARYFLRHDREILSRVDDSVVRVVDDTAALMRRSRVAASGLRRNSPVLRLPLASVTNLLLEPVGISRTHCPAQPDC